MSFKILTLGDQFATVDLMQENVLDTFSSRQLFTAVDGSKVEPSERDEPSEFDAIEFVSLDLAWPTIPFQRNDEIREFSGDLAEIAALAADVNAIITHIGGVSQAVIEAAPDLRIIGCCRGGPVNVNVDAASALHIPVINAPARNSQAVVEYTIGLLIAVCRGIAPAHHAFAQGVWRSDLYQYVNTGRELAGQTIGLVGFGAVARSLLPFLKLFQMGVVAYDPYVDDAIFIEHDVEPVSFAGLLAEADVVSLHMRATAANVGMMGAAEFAQMKQGAYFLNTARGSLVDEAALYNALQEGKLAGAGLDTFVEEPPPPDWPLRTLPNVTCTPHIGGASQNSAQRGVAMIADDFANLLSGQPLVNCVNKDEIQLSHAKN